MLLTMKTWEGRRAKVSIHTSSNNHKIFSTRPGLSLCSLHRHVHPLPHARTPSFVLKYPVSMQGWMSLPVPFLPLFLEWRSSFFVAQFIFSCCLLRNVHQKSGRGKKKKEKNEKQERRMGGKQKKRKEELICIFLTNEEFSLLHFPPCPFLWRIFLRRILL